MTLSIGLQQNSWSIVDRFFSSEDASLFAEMLPAGPGLIPMAVEALAVYVYNQQYVAQEIVRPDGSVECGEPLSANFLAGDTARVLYQAVAWYQQIEVQLQQIDGEWESRAEGCFTFLRRDEQQTTYWTVRDVAGDVLSRWTLQVEQDGELQQAMSFVAAHEQDKKNSAKPQSRDERVLVDAYQNYGRRLHRISHLLRHLQALGMRSTQEYRGWCTQCRLGDELLKSPQQRRREVDLKNKKTKTRGGTSFAAIATRIYEGRSREADLQTEYIGRIARAFDKGLAGGARKAYLQLLLLAEERAKFFGLEAVIPRLGPISSNIFVEALANLAHNHRHWIRPLDQWVPTSHDPRQQFSSLARHLLAEYPVPVFMDAAWCRGRKISAQWQQVWFMHLGRGRNIRTAEGLPLVLSKRMAHEFLQAPDHYTVSEALRWGQVLGQDGTRELLEALLDTELGHCFTNEDFWGTVVHFLAKNPLLDPTYVGPIIDYIHHRKYAPQELVQPGGKVEVAPPPEPNFSMKSRSVAKLLDQVEAWHRHLNHEEKSPEVQWKKSSIADYYYQEKDEENGGFLQWTITELLSKNELKTEGRSLRHCVSSYAGQCKEGKTSVWSLSVRDGRGEDIRLVTIAINPWTRNITQARSRYNLRPVLSSDGMRFSRKVEEGFGRYLQRGKSMLQAWVKQEGLGSKGQDLNTWLRY